ncbi:developmental regulator flbA [Diaporthe amygdali]|uniref:developmental regulator flbA n=1 Tax=Phomopsis amygdali TaxID=1214568 RepID=UPI0022FDF9C2|nr:developmental regulator flbA [Diaporthe amygdali]KAJ0118085.1 developmental regulator flbA [Diaporthe amygdali]
MAAGVSSPARPSPVYLHDPLSHTNNNSSNFISAPPHHSASTTSSSGLSSLTCPPPAAPHLSSSSPSSQDNPRRPRPVIVSPNSTTSSTSASPSISTPANVAISPLASSPLESVADSVLTRPRPQQSPVNSARGDPRLQKPAGFFAFAASAIDRTQSAIATISDQTVRHQRSLSRLSITGDSAAHHLSAEPSPDRTSRYRPASTLSSASSSNLLSPQLGSKFPSSQTSPAQDPPYSRPYSETDPSHPPPILLPRIDNKMHQTSSRLLRMTDDDRPFTKDFKDLFATLIVSLLPLSAHRVRLTKVEHTFLSEDAINNLGSLKFSQSNRMPDPKDPSRIVTTTTTTTFSMAKDMARSICQRFLEARFIESADGKYQQVYTMKGSVWQLTPKGISILDRFCSRNGIQQKQVAELIGNSLPQLVILEREGQTDKLTTDRGTIEVLFRRFVGIGGFNIKSNVNSADSDSLSDYKDGLTGVKMAAERKVGGKTFKNTFTGKAATDWLMDCSTTVDRRETIEVAGLFVEYELMEAIQQDRAYMSQYPGSHLFQPTKHAIYTLTPRAHDLVNGALTRGRSSEGEVSSGIRPGVARDSNTQRLDKILGDPALRLLFRENLRETHCEENLSFYIDVDEFVRSCKQAIRQAQKNPTSTSMDGIKEIMAQAYGIYNAFLAPGSPCELNIDHQLRSNLATRMTKAVGQDVAMIDTLHEVTALFEDAQNAVFKLMASDSVPKFLRSPKYEQVLKNYDFDTITHPVGKDAGAPGRLLERSQSRSNRK